MWETQVWSLGQEDTLEKEMATHSVLLPGKFHGWRSLVGYRPWVHKESYTTERLHFLSFHHYSYHSLSSCQTTRKEHSPNHQQKTELNLLSMALLTIARTSFPHSQSLPSGCFHKPLILIHQRTENENHNFRKLSKMITWITALCKLMKLNHATQDIEVESSDKMWSTGEGNGKPIQHSCLRNPMNSMKRQKIMTLKDEPSRL